MVAPTTSASVLHGQLWSSLQRYFQQHSGPRDSKNSNTTTGGISMEPHAIIGLSPLHIAVFVYYVTMSSLGPLLIRFSEEDSGKLEYNTASAVLCIEAVKLAVCYASELRREADKKGNNTPVPRKQQFGSSTGKISWNQWAVYGIPSFLYAILNNLTFYATYGLGPHYYALFSTGKVLCAAVAARVLMQKKLNEIQWVALVLLACSLCVAKVGKDRELLVHHDEQMNKAIVEQPQPGVVVEQDVGTAATTPTDSATENAKILSSQQHQKFFFGFLAVIATCVLSGSSGVVNEFLLKRMDSEESFMKKNLWMYQWGCLLNGTACFVSLNSNQTFFHGFNLPVILLILVKAAEGLGASFLLSYFDNIVKGFASCVQVLAVTFFNYLLFAGEDVNISFCLALVIFFCSSYLYSGRHNATLLASGAGGQQIQIGPGPPQRGGTTRFQPVPTVDPEEISSNANRSEKQAVGMNPDQLSDLEMGRVSNHERTSTEGTSIGNSSYNLSSGPGIITSSDEPPRGASVAPHVLAQDSHYGVTTDQSQMNKPSLFPTFSPMKTSAVSGTAASSQEQPHQSSHSKGAHSTGSVSSTGSSTSAGSSAFSTHSVTSYYVAEHHGEIARPVSDNSTFSHLYSGNDPAGAATFGTEVEVDIADVDIDVLAEKHQVPVKSDAALFEEFLGGNGDSAPMPEFILSKNVPMQICMPKKFLMRSALRGIFHSCFGICDAVISMIC
ncbi:unnamed protein product [Amoebophrya sp. A120]|nr:unnamed protein product [Amoebophrya sp. A120]|eukprot:GSA120T00015655001.1